MERLKQDIPKFRSWISAESAVEWEIFLQREIGDLLSEPAEGKWLFEDLFEASTVPVDETEPPVEDQHPPNEELSSMFAAMHQPCEVMNAIILAVIHVYACNGILYS